MILKSVLLYIVIQHCRVLQRPPVVLSLTFPELLCYKKPYVIVRNNVGLIESDLKKMHTNVCFLLQDKKKREPYENATYCDCDKALEIILTLK